MKLVGPTSILEDREHCRQGHRPRIYSRAGEFRRRRDDCCAPDPLGEVGEKHCSRRFAAYVEDQQQPTSSITTISCCIGEGGHASYWPTTRGRGGDQVGRTNIRTPTGSVGTIMRRLNREVGGLPWSVMMTSRSISFRARPCANLDFPSALQSVGGFFTARPQKSLDAADSGRCQWRDRPARERFTKNLWTERGSEERRS